VKALHHILIAGAVGAVAAFAGVAQAQSGHDHHAAPAPATTKVAQTAPAEMSEGEVRKIDAAGKKITLKHGPLKNLDMPAMTMVFRVRDPAWLNQMKPGDRIRFVVERVNGALTLTEFQPAR